MNPDLSGCCASRCSGRSGCPYARGTGVGIIRPPEERRETSLRHENQNRFGPLCVWRMDGHGLRHGRQIHGGGGAGERLLSRNASRLAGSDYRRNALADPSPQPRLQQHPDARNKPPMPAGRSANRTSSSGRGMVCAMRRSSIASSRATPSSICRPRMRTSCAPAA